MADLTITPKWNTAINMVENGQVISGGVNGNANIATRQLGENIFFLFDAMNIIQSTMETSQSVDAKIQNLITGTIGELSSLQTSNKSNIVAAINEILNTGSAGTAYVDNSINSAKTEMTNLMTQKDDALRTELLADIQQNVDDLTTMINNVDLNGSQDFQTIISNIASIQSELNLCLARAPISIEREEYPTEIFPNTPAEIYTINCTGRRGISMVASVFYGIAPGYNVNDSDIGGNLILELFDGTQTQTKTIQLTVGQARDGYDLTYIRSLDPQKTYTVTLSMTSSLLTSIRSTIYGFTN